MFDESLFQPGKSYVLAVSGGVDSMCLLAMMEPIAQRLKLSIIVAHAQHGIRDDDYIDRDIVAQAALSRGYQFKTIALQLRGAGEAEARHARYAFLHRVRTESSAEAVVTAHHEDDVVETMIINLLRGTHRRGLVSLRSTKTLLRPLLQMRKDTLVAFAQRSGVAWREDETNSDTRYLRNWVRRTLKQKMTHEQRSQLLRIRNELMGIDTEIESTVAMLADLLLRDGGKKLYMRRADFVVLPRVVAFELLRVLLENRDIEVTQSRLEYMWIMGKTLHSARRVSVTKNMILRIENGAVCIE